MIPRDLTGSLFYVIVTSVPPASMSYKHTIKKLREAIAAAERNPNLYSEQEFRYLKKQLRVLVEGHEAQIEARRQVQGFKK